MKANELRIGNLFIDKLTNTILECIGIDKNGNFSFYVIDRSKFPLPNGWKAEPIPLTEEWFLKFGFGLFPWGWVNKEADRSLRITIKNYFEREGNASLKIEYVHQLQNLYFALTGTELILAL